MPELPSLEDIVASLENEASAIETQQKELTGRLEALHARVRDLSKRLTQMKKGPKSTGARRGRKPKAVEPSTAPVSVVAAE